jgi:hypothetical protein
MDKTALVYTKDEALSLEPKNRPLCFRVPSKIYHDVFESIGTASLCWNPRPSDEVFSAEEAEKVAVNLLFNIATELEKAGLVYEKWPEGWK